MKKRKRRKYCALAVVRRSQNFSPCRRTAKIAGDGLYHHLQTLSGEDDAGNFELSW